VLLANEPAGELDTATAADVFGALAAASSGLEVTVLVATHDRALIDLAGTVLSLADGRIAPGLAEPRP
jgi:ABC-type lipoprotein export system ATPase subunit